MKKIFFAALMAVTLSAGAQTQEWDGVTIVEHSYGQKISSNGVWSVGFPADGGTVCYNRVTGAAAYYPEASYSRGHVVSDNGWVVGSYLRDEDVTKPVIMVDNEAFTPDVFDPSVSGNIHSITPSGNRICGVVENPVTGESNLPYYCDIDANGNFGPIQYLPHPKEDFFGARPQYCSATWISNDGNTIAGQVKDNQGFVLYPIIYTCDANGVWSYTLPSESLFNLNHIKVPEPVKDISQMFPDLEYPEVQNYMSAEEYARFVLNGSPYEELDSYMTPEQFEAYYAASDYYTEKQQEYLEYFDQYEATYFELLDTSVFFVQNAMALSGDGLWLASSAQVDDLSDPMNPVGYYVPYVCNLVTGEWTKIGEDKKNYHVNQVLSGGMVVMNDYPAGEQPVSSYLYLSNEKRLISVLDYLQGTNPSAAEWVRTNLTDSFIIGIGSDGSTPIYGNKTTVTGQVAFSDDLSVMVGAVDGYAFMKDMYFTYIFEDLNTGVKGIETDSVKDGVYPVYNLQGVKVGVSKDMDKLPKGIYIVGGKKLIKS